MSSKRRRRLERSRPRAQGRVLTRALSGVRALERAGSDGSPEYVIEGRIVPFGEVTSVQDEPGGRVYRETIARGATAELDPSSVLLESRLTPDVGQLHQGAVLVGRGTWGEARDDGHWMGFQLANTSAGRDTWELARAGVLRDLSVVMAPRAERTRQDGVIERTRVDVRRVAILENGAYPGAQVTAVRSAPEGRTMHTCSDCGGDLIPGVAHTCPRASRGSRRDASRAAAPAQGAGATSAQGDAEDLEDDEDDEADDEPVQLQDRRRRRNRTRVTTSVDVQRGAAERDAIQALQRGGSRVTVTRAETVYGPGQEHSFFRDGYTVSRGGASEDVSQARERLERHYRQLEDIDLAIQRATYLGRAGDVLSSEIPGAYPSEYLPGLLVQRVLKARPMAGFYQHVPISDGRPRIYPVVTTSTSVSAQASEGTNPAASDFGTTATTVTPLFYGGETSVSRQVIDGADPSIDAMLNQDLTEAYMQASEAIVRAAVEAGSTASGVTLTAATPDAGIRSLVLNHYANVFMPAERVFLPTTLLGSWLGQNDTTGRPIAPSYGPMNSDSVAGAQGIPAANVLGVEAVQSWSSTAGAGAGVGGVAVIGRSTDFAVFESNIVNFQYGEGAGAPAAIRIGLWAYLVTGLRRGSRKATGA